MNCDIRYQKIDFNGKPVRFWIFTKNRTELNQNRFLPNPNLGSGRCRALLLFSTMVKDGYENQKKKKLMVSNIAIEAITIEWKEEWYYCYNQFFRSSTYLFFRGMNGRGDGKNLHKDIYTIYLTWFKSSYGIPH